MIISSLQPPSRNQPQKSRVFDVFNRINRAGKKVIISLAYPGSSFALQREDPLDLLSSSIGNGAPRSDQLQSGFAC
jgi:hypothetical protein